MESCGPYGPLAAAHKAENTGSAQVFGAGITYIAALAEIPANTYLPAIAGSGCREVVAPISAQSDSVAGLSFSGIAS